MSEYHCRPSPAIVTWQPESVTVISVEAVMSLLVETDPGSWARAQPELAWETPVPAFMHMEMGLVDELG